MATPSIFLAHASGDEPFVRHLGADLAWLGARVWVAEAEMRTGDSLLTKISRASDLTHLAVVMSPEASLSGWVRDELEPALARDGIEPLLIYYRPCDLPGFLRNGAVADFTDSLGYDRALSSLARALGLPEGPGGRRNDRHDHLPSRPKRWFCIKCGAGPMPGHDDYVCTGCGVLRPFVGGTATMWGCPRCRQMNLFVAHYCEWCGHPLRATAG